MREQRTKAEVKKQNQNLQDNTHPLSPLPHPGINQPPPTYLIPPSPPLFAVIIQWT